MTLGVSFNQQYRCLGNGDGYVSNPKCPEMFPNPLQFKFVQSAVVQFHRGNGTQREIVRFGSLNGINDLCITLEHLYQDIGIKYNHDFVPRRHALSRSPDSVTSRPAHIPDNSLRAAAGVGDVARCAL